MYMRRANILCVCVCMHVFLCVFVCVYVYVCVFAGYAMKLKQHYYGYLGGRRCYTESLWEGGQDSRCGYYHNDRLDSILGVTVRLAYSEWHGHPDLFSVIYLHAPIHRGG